MNRYLSLLVSIVAPAFAAVMLVFGAQPIGAATLAERVPCIALAILAVTLGIIHMRISPSGAARAEAAMWWGLSLFLCVAACTSPHLSLLAIGAALSLAGTSIARLVARAGRSGALSRSAFHRRIFT